MSGKKVRTFMNITVIAKQRKCVDKLFICTLILWVMLFMFFTTFCLTIKSRGSAICQRALNTYSLVPTSLVVVRHLPKPNVANRGVAPSIQNQTEDALNENFAAQGTLSNVEFTGKKEAVRNEALVVSDKRKVHLEDKELVVGKRIKQKGVSNIGSKSDKASNRNGGYQYNDVAKEYTNHAKEDKYKYYKLGEIKTKYEDKFVLFNSEMCVNTDAIIIVPSTANHSKARDAIRNTYGTVSRDRRFKFEKGVKVNITVRVLFVFGKVHSAEDRKQIREEHSLFKDILFIDFVDSYYNLTRKMVNAFRWVNEFCTNVSYVIKADDDVFVNVPLLLSKVTESHGTSRDKLFGYVYTGRRPVNRSGRWGVTHDVYPFARYPHYISGTSYVISGHLLRQIVYYAQYFPYLHIEDAFITGVICNMVLGATLEHFEQSSQYLDNTPNECKFVASGRYVQTNVKPDKMFAIWITMLDYDKHCKSKV